MPKIILRNFRVLCDFMDVYQFMIEVYEKDWRNGVSAPFLAAAALSEHYRRLKPLGATHMTGGGNIFYEKIGFKPLIHWTFWEKKAD